MLFITIVQYKLIGATKLSSMNQDEDQKQSSNLIGYLIFLCGQWISILGSNIVNFVIIWFLALTTESEFVLGLSAFLGFMPFILVTPIAGVFVDRWSRKKVIVFVDFMQAFFTLILIAAFISNLFTDIQLVLILLSLNFIRGIFGAFHTSATDTLLPIMVPRDQLSRINGMNYFVNAGINIIGPIIAPILLEIFPDITQILWLDVITFLLAIVPTLLITIPKIIKKVEKIEKPSFGHEFIEGIRFIIKTPGLFPLLFVFAGANFFLTPLFTQLAFFIKFIHGGQAQDFGFIAALQQTGLLIGSFIMTFWKGFKNHALGVAFGLFLGYLGLVIMLLAPIGFFLILGIGIFITGFVLPVANVSSEAIWGATVPREVLGRVYAVRRTLAQFSAPVSMLLSGIFAELYGLTIILWVASILGLTVLGFTWFFTPLPEVEKRISIQRSNTKDA